MSSSPSSSSAPSTPAINTTATASSTFSSTPPSSLLTTSTPSPASPTPTTSFTYTTASSSTTPSSVSSTSSSTSTSLAVEQQSSSVLPTTSATTTSALSPTSVSAAPALTSSTTTPSTATHSSSPGFFANTAAVAGTFTVVGLVGIAVVIALVFFIAKRRAKTYEDDTEFLDRSPDPPMDPPVTQIEDFSASDHTHYGAPPMALTSHTPVFYSDRAHNLHPQALQAGSFSQPPTTHGYSSFYPVGYAQDYPAQRIYSPEDYEIGYPPVTPHGNPSIPNPRDFSGVQLESTPAHAQAAFPDTLRPSAKSTLTVPAQTADSRFSVDSFYAGIAADSPVSPGRAL